MATKPERRKYYISPLRPRKTKSLPELYVIDEELFLLMRAKLLKKENEEWRKNFQEAMWGGLIPKKTESSV